MYSPRPRFQFSLRLLFVWMLALCVLLALAKLPWPSNIFCAPLYASALAGYAGSRSYWLAAAMGGLGSLVASYLLMIVQAERIPMPQQADVQLVPWVSTCCCFPGGAYVGLAIAVLATGHRIKRRFQSKLDALGYSLMASDGDDEDSPSGESSDQSPFDD